MMTCKRIQRRLSSFLDGEVSSDDAGRIEQHLALCPACRSEARALTATYQLLELYPQALRPDVHSMKAPAGVTVRRRLTLPAWSSRLAGRRASGLLPLVTGLLVGVVLEIWLWPPMSPPVFPAPVFVDQHALPPRDREAFGVLARDPLEEVYVTLTSATSR
jgi:anti-sigma factor RsiW